jgi:hypothetical protein
VRLAGDGHAGDRSTGHRCAASFAVVVGEDGVIKFAWLDPVGCLNALFLAAVATPWPQSPDFPVISVISCDVVCAVQKGCGPVTCIVEMGSNPTEGTQTVEALAQADGVFMFAGSPHHPLVPTFCPQFQITCRQLR